MYKLLDLAPPKQNFWVRQWGGGVCRSIVGTGPKYISFINKYDQI